MNPVLTQSIDHPEFGSILPQAVAFAALGTSDKTVNAFRKAGKLIEGEHFVRVPQRAGMPRLYWTVTGLQALAIALNTERAKSFHAELTQWVEERSRRQTAIEHQPRGSAVASDTRAMHADYADYEPVSLTNWQQSEAPTTNNYREQSTAPSHYSLAELQELRAIAQSERDSQMLALLDKAITALTTSQPTQSQPAERVVYVQPQKTTHINFLWNWNGGSNNYGNGSVEAIFVVALITVLLSGLWMAAFVASHRSQPAYPSRPQVSSQV